MNSYKNNLEKARKYNAILLEKMKSVCEEYGITYYLDSGALLGAVRHQSFIPWDDDVDITFIREDYEKLLKVPREVWGDDFELVSYRNLGTNDKWLDYTTRLFYLGETVPVQTFDKLGGNIDKKYLNRIVLDCFVLDNTYSSKRRQNILVKKLTILYGLSMGHRGKLDMGEYHGISKVVVGVLAFVGRLLPLNFIINMYENSIKSVPGESGYLFVSNWPLSVLKLQFDKKWYEESTNVLIDGKEYNAPKEYHKLLTKIYGDYMKLPPEEKRKPYHIRKDEI